MTPEEAFLFGVFVGVVITFIFMLTIYVIHLNKKDQERVDKFADKASNPKAHYIGKDK